jgi:hypothetical protein
MNLQKQFKKERLIKMMNEKAIERMNEIIEWSEEYRMSIYDAVYEMVFTFYETAGFDVEELEKELRSKSEAELIEMYCNI